MLLFIVAITWIQQPVVAIGQRQGLREQVGLARKGNKSYKQNSVMNHRRVAGMGGKGGKNKGGDDESEGVCDSEPRTLERTVLVTFQNLRPETITDAQRAALEEAFIVTYNRLALELCPEGSFRIIESVMFGIDPPTRRSLTAEQDAEQDGRKLRFTRGRNTFPFNVVFGCNDRCPNDSELLTNDAGRRSILEDLERHSEDGDGGPTECLPCETPTPEVFTLAYNDVIAEFEEGLGLTLDSVDDVTELIEFPNCDAAVVLRNATLTIPFDGDPAEATPEQLLAVAEGVKQTLNALNALDPDTCDEFFRVVIAAEAVVNSEPQDDTRRRRLRFKRRGTAVVNIVWQCRNTCPQGTILEQNDAGRRQLTSGSSSFNKPLTFLRELQEAGECLCPAGASEFRLPTRDEFDTAFNETIETLIDENVVTFIDEIGDVTEAQEVQCPTEQEKRQTILAVQVDAEPEAIQDDEAAVVASLIELVYTDLTSRLCFGGVRTILQITFLGAVAVGVETTEVRQLRFEFQTQLVFNIVYSCRRCPNGNLFNDAARRLSIKPPSNVVTMNIIPRQLQDIQGDQCFCDVDFVEEARIPTTQEFEDALSGAIDASPELNFTATGTITEAEETSAPVTEAPITLAPVTPLPSMLPPVTTAPITSSPVTSNPITSAPATSAPATSAPTTSAPVTSAPVTSAPVTSAPVTAAPVTAAPVTAAPVTASPVTATPVSSAPVVPPTPRPTTPFPITQSPVAPRLSIAVTYVVALRNGENGTYVDDIIGAMDFLATQIASEAFPAVRRRLSVMVELPTTLTSVTEEACPTFIPATDECLAVLHSITVRIEGGDIESDTEEFRALLEQAILDSDLQTFLDQINSASVVYIVTGLTPPEIEDTPRPVEAVTPAPVNPPEEAPGTNERQECIFVDFELDIIRCTCREGWTGENGCFEDIPECDDGPCDFPGGFCVERSGDQGQYACGCESGWEPSGESNSHGPTSCRLVNPCEDNPCHTDARCTISEAPSDFSCNCNDGFEGDGFQCDRIDEESSTGPIAVPPQLDPEPENPDPVISMCATVTCPDNNVCTDTPVGATCSCETGFEGGNNGRSACTDVNECCEGCNTGCDEFADCSNIPGSFFCVCQKGYVDKPGSPKQGTDCIPLNECSRPELNTCNLGTQVCLDRPPPENGSGDGFECVPITPAPTSPPTEQPVEEVIPLPPPPPPPPPPCAAVGSSCLSLTCCDTNAECLDDICCVADGFSGCGTDGRNCCNTPDFNCQSDTCMACISTGGGTCTSSTDCCDASAACEGGTCCISDGSSGCGGDSSNCCNSPSATCNSITDTCQAACAALGSGCGAGGDCCDSNASCVSGTCCIADRDTGCTTETDCCNFGSDSFCDASNTCLPCVILGDTSCGIDDDCCDASASCNSGTCCITDGANGCTMDDQCCNFGGGSFCNFSGTCQPCLALGDTSCDVDGDCCDDAASCILNTCCLAAIVSGCTVDTDCCGGSASFCDGLNICQPCVLNDAGANSCTSSDECCDDTSRCNTGNSECVICIPLGSSSSCSEFDPCCSGTCGGASNRCCIENGNLGCGTDSALCCSAPDATCVSDMCVACLATGESTCASATDCCDTNASCVSGTCCIATGDSSCASAGDCCESNALCDAVSGTCCIANGDPGCASDIDCCGGGISSRCEFFSTTATCEVCVAVGDSCGSSSDCCGSARCGSASGQCQECIANGEGPCGTVPCCFLGCNPGTNICDFPA